MDTERIVASSEVVASRVAEELGGNYTTAVLRDALTVGNPSGSFILDFNVEWSSAEESADIANAFARAYLSDREENARALVDSVNAGILDQIQILQDLLVEASPSEQLVINDQIAELRAQQNALISLAIFPGTVVSSSSASDADPGLGLALYLPAGLALGLLVGAMLALVVDRLDDRVLNARRLQGLFASEVLVSKTDPERLDAAGDCLLAAGSPVPGGSSKRLAVQRMGGSSRQKLEATFAQARDILSGSAEVSPGVAQEEPAIATFTVADGGGTVRRAAASQSASAVVFLVDPQTSRKAVHSTAEVLSSTGWGGAMLGWLDQGVPGTIHGK